MFRQRSCSILSLALSLPLLDFSLFASKGAGVIAEVVRFRVVDLNGIKEEIAGLGQEGIDAKGEIVEVRRERV